MKTDDLAIPVSLAKRCMLPKQAGVYMLVHQPTGANYVGASKNMRGRMIAHRQNFKANHGPRRMIAMLGGEAKNITVQVMEFCNPENLRERERHWIDRLKPTLNVVHPRNV